MQQKQKTFFSKLTILLAVISLTLAAAGCNSANPQTKVTLKIWKPFVDSENMNVIIQEYRKVNPNVTIEYTKKNIETYEQDLLNALAAGNGPDIFSINNTWLNQYLDKIVPAPNNFYTIREYREAFVDAVANDMIRDNKIYGTAMWVDSLALYYNKDLMGTAGIATPPKTWDQLARDVRTIKTQDSTGYFTRSGVAMGMYDNVNRAQDIIYLLMLQAGAVPWSSDGRSSTIASSIQRNGESFSPGAEGLGFYTSFANPNSANYNWNAESDYSVDAFANGRAAYLYGYSYTREQIDAKSPNLNYDVANVPQFDLSQPSVNYATYFAEVVSKQATSQVQAAAWDFLKFATSKPVLDAYYARDKQPSSRRDLIALQTSDPEIGVFAHANLTAKTIQKYDEPKFDAIFAEAVGNVLFRGQTPQSALSRAQTQIGTLVTQRLF
jgi:ABC-type glycerol-3-phosphate transport system substrate-binding protein